MHGKPAAGAAPDKKEIPEGLLSFVSLIIDFIVYPWAMGRKKK